MLTGFPSISILQRTASSSSLATGNGNPAEVKRETSLIDFDAEPGLAVMVAETQAQPSTTCQSVGQSTSTPSGDNWACFNNIQENMVSEAPPSSNSLESLLLQSSFSASGSASPAPPPTLPLNSFAVQWAGTQQQQQLLAQAASNQPPAAQLALSFPGSSNQVSFAPMICFPKIFVDK